MVSLKKNIALSDSGFVFNPTNGDSFSLNGIGLDILLMLKESKREEEVKKALREKYEVDEATVEKDYYDFLKMLGQFKLLDVQ